MSKTPEQLFSAVLEYYREAHSDWGLVQPITRIPADFAEFIGCFSVSYRELTPLAKKLGSSENELRLAAYFYIQKVLFAEGADYYRVLGLHETADAKDIRRRYRLLIGVLHPDRMSEEPQWQEAYVRRLNKAYGVLKQRDKKQAYDRELKQQRATASRQRSARVQPGAVAAQRVHPAPVPGEILYRFGLVQRHPKAAIWGFIFLLLLIVVLLSIVSRSSDNLEWMGEDALRPSFSEKTALITQAEVSNPAEPLIAIVRESKPPAVVVENKDMAVASPMPEQKSDAGQAVPVSSVSVNIPSSAAPDDGEEILLPAVSSPQPPLSAVIDPVRANETDAQTEREAPVGVSSPEGGEAGSTVLPEEEQKMTVAPEDAIPLPAPLEHNITPVKPVKTVPDKVVLEPPEKTKQLRPQVTPVATHDSGRSSKTLHQDRVSAIDSPKKPRRKVHASHFPSQHPNGVVQRAKDIPEKPEQVLPIGFDGANVNEREHGRLAALFVKAEPLQLPADALEYPRLQPEFVVMQYVNSYETGNIRKLLQLFTLKPATNFGSGRGPLRQGYANVFTDYKDRKMDVRQLTMRQSAPDAILAKAVVQIKAQRVGSNSIQEYHGDMYFQLLRKGNKLYISQLFHNVKAGN